MSATASGHNDSRRQSIQAAVKQLIEEPPKLHRLDDQEPGDDPVAEDGLVGWGIQGSFLELMMELVPPDSLTLEIGSGLSTVCLAIIGSEHICVSPFHKEHNRIRHYCRTHQISTERIRFIPMKSSAALPSLDVGGRKLDFALIDGSHTFPQPLIDYYYVNEHLKVGGHLAIDDLNISSVGILHRFLITEPAYEFVKFDRLKTGVYQKVGDTSTKESWSGQKCNSKYPDFSYLPFQTRVQEKLLRIGLGRVPGLRRAYHLLKSLAGTDG